MKNQTIQKCRASRLYTKISNAVLQDSRLSYFDRGLISYILSLPGDWTIQANHLYSKEVGGGKRHIVTASMRKLKDLGYLSLEVIRDQKGHVKEWRWTAYDNPSDNPLCPPVALPIEGSSTSSQPASGFPASGLSATTKETEETKETQRERKGLVLVDDGASFSWENYGLSPDAVSAAKKYLVVKNSKLEWRDASIKPSPSEWQDLTPAFRCVPTNARQGEQ